VEVNIGEEVHVNGPMFVELKWEGPLHIDNGTLPSNKDTFKALQFSAVYIWFRQYPKASPPQLVCMRAGPADLANAWWSGTRSSCPGALFRHCSSEAVYVAQGHLRAPCTMLRIRIRLSDTW
jgi:hypothetical protein